MKVLGYSVGARHAVPLLDQRHYLEMFFIRIWYKYPGFPLSKGEELSTHPLREFSEQMYYLQPATVSYLLHIKPCHHNLATMLAQEYDRLCLGSAPE